MKLLKNISINLGKKIIEDGSILIDGEKIKVAGPEIESLNDDEFEVVDGKGMCATAAYIDSHIHGGNGYDCNDGTEEALLGMSDFYVQHGIAAYYPSTSSDPLEKIEKAFSVIRKIIQQNAPGTVEILGTHMEGPFINKKHKGCQAESRILEMTDESFEIVKRNADIIKRITIAPEIPINGERIPELIKMGIVVSGGHSDATYLESMEASKAGMTMVTHLHSSMSTIKKEGPYRVSGMLEAALDIDELYTEIIADRKHLPDELMRIAYKCKGPEKLMICSDANRGAGLKEGGTIFTCGQEAIVADGVAMLPDKSSFASSITPIDQMVRNLVYYVGVPLSDALLMASATPAKMMGVFDRKGSIEAGKDADIILLDQSLNVKMTVCRGKIAFTDL